MSAGAEWRSMWADRGHRIAATPHAAAAVGTLLGMMALTESIVRAIGNGDSVRFGLALGLLALSTTLPLALLPAAGAGVAVGAASVLSVAPFHSLTVAGACAQLIVLYRLGRSGSQLLAAALALPFLGLTLAGVPHAETRVLTVLLAACPGGGLGRCRAAGAE